MTKYYCDVCGAELTLGGSKTTLESGEYYAEIKVKMVKDGIPAYLCKRCLEKFLKECTIFGK